MSTSTSLSINQKGFNPLILLLAFLLISGGIIGGLSLIRQNYINPVILPSPSSIPKVLDISCTQDDQCPDSYKCQALESQGTVCSAGASKESCQLITKIIKGQCKLVEGGSCKTDNDCYVGLICHRNICTNPISKVSCLGANDTSCPDGYKCIQRCGPPIARIGDNQPPGYFCEVEELANKPRNCPICLASNTQISTPTGNINVKDLKVGMKVYSLNKQSKKVVVDVIKVSATLVYPTHQVSYLVLADSRQLWVSPNHPTINGGEVGQLKIGQRYDDSVISSVELIPYWDNKTYDLLPNSETGFYFANGILMGSTLKK